MTRAGWTYINAVFFWQLKYQISHYIFAANHWWPALGMASLLPVHDYVWFIQKA
jgi:hypothetical protein